MAILLAVLETHVHGRIQNVLELKIATTRNSISDIYICVEAITF